jgi:hypothetical protein
LCGKVDEVGVASRTNNVSVVCLTETWLDDEISNSYVGISGYFVIRKDRTSTVREDGDGVCVYVKEDMSWGRLFLENEAAKEIESIWIQLTP